MWPAVSLNPDDLWQVHDATPFEVTKRMSRARFLELFRGTLIEIGLHRDAAMSAGFNRLRCFMPTLGNCLQFDPVSLQAIGSWTEIPAGGGPNPTFKPQKASMPMGLHYAGQKVARSAQVKNHALACFLKLWRRKQPELSLNHEGLVPPDSWTWQEVCATSSMIQLPAVADLPAAPEIQEGAIAPGALADIESRQRPDEQPPPLPAVEGPSTAASDDESDISDWPPRSEPTSPSASDVSADGEELVGIIPPDEAVDNMKWFQQGQKVHILRRDDLQGRRLPWCRDAAFPQDPQKEGEGLGTMDRTRVCQRCLGRMPSSLYVALADQCGWMH